MLMGGTEVLLSLVSSSAGARVERPFFWRLMPFEALGLCFSRVFPFGGVFGKLLGGGGRGGGGKDWVEHG